MVFQKLIKYVKKPSSTPNLPTRVVLIRCIFADVCAEKFGCKGKKKAERSISAVNFFQIQHFYKLFLDITEEEFNRTRNLFRVCEWCRYNRLKDLDEVSEDFQMKKMKSRPSWFSGINFNELCNGKDADSNLQKFQWTHKNSVWLDRVRIGGKAFKQADHDSDVIGFLNFDRTKMFASSCQGGSDTCTECHKFAEMIRQHTDYPNTVDLKRKRNITALEEEITPEETKIRKIYFRESINQFAPAKGGSKFHQSFLYARGALSKTVNVASASAPLSGSNILSTQSILLDSASLSMYVCNVGSSYKCTFPGCNRLNGFGNISKAQEHINLAHTNLLNVLIQSRSNSSSKETQTTQPVLQPNIENIAAGIFILKNTFYNLK